MNIKYKTFLGNKYKYLSCIYCQVIYSIQTTTYKSMVQWSIPHVQVFMSLVGLKKDNQI